MINYLWKPVTNHRCCCITWKCDLLLNFTQT